MRRASLLLLVLGCAPAWPAGASEQSQALSARGLIELNAGHDQQALELFDRAVNTDPSDATARFQRGSTRAKLGNYAGAAEDLQAALALRPEFPQAQLELGIALTELHKYHEAEPYLLLAQRYPDLDAQASFYLGIAQLRLDRFDDAQRNFERARTRDPSTDLPARYYEAVIAFRRHKYSEAEKGFSSVAEATPNSAVGRESLDFLVALRRSQRAAYSVFGTLALEYDSNVTLGPGSSTVPGAITGEGDGRFVINAGGRYVPLTVGPASLTVGYEFFQSLQFHLTDFNLQDHRPMLQLTVDLDPVLLGIIGRYDYYLLSTSSFLQEATAFPWVDVREAGIGRSEVYARIQWRDYKLHALHDMCPQGTTCDVPGFTQLDGFYSFAGVRQVLDLGAPNRELWFGYQLGFTTPDNLGSPQYEYSSNQLDIALRWPLPYSIIGQTGFRWEHQNYAPESAMLPNGNGSTARVDNDYRAVVSVERPLSEISEHLFVNAAWYGTFNDSNNSLFAYNRQIGTFGAEVRF